MEWITMVKSWVELHSIAVQLVLVLMALALFLGKPFYGCHGGRTSAWPPGPPAWPIVGHLHLLGQLPHQSFFKLSKTYGPLLGLRLGAIRTIVVSSPQMAKEIMQTHDLVFANRPLSKGAIHMNYGNMGFAPYGSLWKRMRHLCATELFYWEALEVDEASAGGGGEGTGEGGGGNGNGGPTTAGRAAAQLVCSGHEHNQQNGDGQEGQGGLWCVCRVRPGEADRGDALPVGRLLCGRFRPLALVARPPLLLEAMAKHG
ncbi:hypothetical protein L7F22_041269 [Adiantum nelumboides]|nr:hypothetical protein [Adiantum nelumboides]